MSEVKKLIEQIKDNAIKLFCTYYETTCSVCKGCPARKIYDNAEQLEQAHAADVAELNKKIDEELGRKEVRCSELMAVNLLGTLNEEYNQRIGLEKAKQLIKEVLGGVK